MVTRLTAIAFVLGPMAASYAEIMVRETARNSTASGSSAGTHNIAYTNAGKNYQRPGNTADSGQLCTSKNSPVA